MNNVQVLLALKLIRGVGDVSLRLIADAVQGGTPWEAVLAEPWRFLRRNIAAAAREAIQTDFPAYMHSAEEKLSQYQEQGVSVCCMLDAEYPEQLHELKDPPVLLYTRGDISILSRMKGVAVVGARKSTPFGTKVAGTLGTAIARRRYNVVSGLAVGIDTAAHRGALAINGKTPALVLM